VLSVAYVPITQISIFRKLLFYLRPQESFVKALGDGLSRRLDQFDVSLIPGTPAELKSTAWDQYEAARWSLKTITLVPGYIASLAVEGSGWSLSCWQLMPDNCLQQFAMEAKRYVDSSNH